MVRRWLTSLLALSALVLAACAQTTVESSASTPDAQTEAEPLPGRDVLKASLDSQQPVVLWFWGAH